MANETASITPLTDGDGNIIYPPTVAQAVYHGEKRIDHELDDINNGLTPQQLTPTVSGIEGSVACFRIGKLCYLSVYGTATSTTISIANLPKAKNNAYATIGSNPAINSSIYIAQNSTTISRTGVTNGNIYWFTLIYVIAD